MAYDMTALHKNMYDNEYCCAPIMFKTGLDLEEEECEIATTALRACAAGCAAEWSAACSRVPAA